MGETIATAKQYITNHSYTNVQPSTLVGIVIGMIREKQEKGSELSNDVFWSQVYEESMLRIERLQFAGGMKTNPPSFSDFLQSNGLFLGVDFGKGEDETGSFELRNKE